MHWLLNFLGILIFFINRFFDRKKQTEPFNWKFWLADNWQEASTSLLLNLSFMLLITKAINTGEIVTILQKLPFWLTLFGIPGVCFALGAGLSWSLYEMFKSKKDSLIPKP